MNVYYTLGSRWGWFTVVSVETRVRISFTSFSCQNLHWLLLITMTGTKKHMCFPYLSLWQGNRQPIGVAPLSTWKISRSSMQDGNGGWGPTLSFGWSNQLKDPKLRLTSVEQIWYCTLHIDWLCRFHPTLFTSQMFTCILQSISQFPVVPHLKPTEKKLKPLLTKIVIGW